MPAVRYAALVTGQADYEPRADCPSFTGLGDVLTRVRGCRGVELKSTALVTVLEGVTTQRRA
jgi:hypothetical protein